MKIALVHDDLIQFGGSERVLMALHEIWPDAEIFTSIVSPRWIEICGSKGLKVRTSYLQKIPGSYKFYKALAPLFLYNIAFESFDFSPFDLVISSSSRFAHSIITKPSTIHVSYIHSPSRNLWDRNSMMLSEMGEGFPGGLLRFLAAPSISALKVSDYIAASRADYILANSEHVRHKIQKYYRRDSKVIFPFFDFDDVNIEDPSLSSYVNEEPYFLILSRLVRWKNIDTAIATFNELGKSLIVIGDGPDKKRLQQMAGSKIKFFSGVSEQMKVSLLLGCKALIVTQEEDFGIAPLEAMALGKPVLAYGRGGVRETVIEGTTGMFYYPSTKEALTQALRNFEGASFNPDAAKKRAAEFSKARFQKEFKEFIESLYVSKS